MRVRFRAGDLVGGIRKSGFRDPVRMSSVGGLLDSGGAFSDVSVACLEGASGEDGVRQLTNCANRRRPAFESRPAHTSPDSGPTRKSAVSGNTVGEIRKWGFRDIARAPWRGGVYWIPPARVLTPPPRALLGISGENGVRKLPTCADRRWPAFESLPTQTSPDFGPARKSAISVDIVGEIRKSGFRDIARAP